MGKKSYSRQAMQKLIQSDTIAVSAGQNVRPISLEIPEEIVVKRIVLNVVLTSQVTDFTSGAFIASVCQNDSFNPDADDSIDENRLVRSAAGTPGTPVNLDHTITMRKLTGSGLSVQLKNLSASDESYYVKLTLHYLEV